jgi:hypothetical protein
LKTFDFLSTAEAAAFAEEFTIAFFSSIESLPFA